jgi:hypothetical protein
MGLFKDDAGHLREAAAYLEGTTGGPDTYLVSRTCIVINGRAPGLTPPRSRVEELMAEMIKEFGAD